MLKRKKNIVTSIKMAGRDSGTLTGKKIKYKNIKLRTQMILSK
nr:MAG TPA: hypothetical protein [Caudoviricetes sp.]